MTSAPSAVPALAPIAIVAGSGALPRMLAEACQRQRRPYQVVIFEGVQLDWVEDHPVIAAVFEKPGRLFASLRQTGCRQVAFAGAIKRPRISPMRFDLKALRLAPMLFKALNSGDDAALRIISEIFENEGITVIAAHDILGDLLAPEGVPTAAQPSDADRADAVRGVEIVQALGRIDVGQGAVVAQGICLAVEAIQGTDVMLDFVARTGADYRPDPNGTRGVLVKLPKPGQDWRTDLPAIGPETVRKAHQAGLAGIVVQAGGVLILGLDETVRTADDLGLFLWCRTT